MNPILKLVSGPIVFLLVYAIPFEGLSVDARVVLAIFCWMVAWWMTQPVPWAITSLLPLLLFPALGIMDITRAGGLEASFSFPASRPHSPLVASPASSKLGSCRYMNSTSSRS